MPHNIAKDDPALFDRRGFSGNSMSYGNNVFERSILRQIALNGPRTPTQRFLALCDLLDTARAMAPMDPAARQRRLRAKAARDHEREQWRAECSRLAAAYRAEASRGV
jgi:hypothetical protein